MISEKIIVIVSLMILILYSIYMLISSSSSSSSSPSSSSSEQRFTVENYPQLTPMNVMYSDNSGNLSTTTDLGLQNLTVISGTSIGGATKIASTLDVSGSTKMASLDVINGNVNVTNGKLLEGGYALIPKGMIMLWSGAHISIPGGWVICNGSNGTPNLQDRFVVGAGNTYSVNSIGGNNDIRLTVDQLPAHSNAMDSSGWHDHHVNDPEHSHGESTTANPNDCKDSGIYRRTHVQDSNHMCRYPTGSTTYPSRTGITINGNGSHTHGIWNTGSGHSINIRPLYYALCYIMKT